MPATTILLSKSTTRVEHGSDSAMASSAACQKPEQHLAPATVSARAPRKRRRGNKFAFCRAAGCVSGRNSQSAQPLARTRRNRLRAVGRCKVVRAAAFRKHLARAVTPDDYAEIVTRDFPTDVQHAEAQLNWTGATFEVLVAIDALGREHADARLFGSHLAASLSFS